MNTIFAKFPVTIIFIVALVALFTLTIGIIRKTEHYQTAALTHAQPVFQIPGHSYGEVMNDLFLNSGR